MGRILFCSQTWKIGKKTALFHFDSKLDTEQVKDVYLALEKRFAENVRGTVTISQYDLFENSVMKEFIMPILQKNKDAAVHII